MDIASAVVALSALAQPTRLRVFHVLAAAGADGIPAGELAKMVEVPHNTMSAHLAILSRAGLIERERRSRQILYRARRDHIEALAASLLSSGSSDA